MNPHLPPEFLASLAERLGWALLHSLWQGALIAAALALVLPLLRSAAARHAACLLTLFALAFAVAVTIARPRPAPSPAHPGTLTTLVVNEPAASASNSATPFAKIARPSPMPATETRDLRTWRERCEPLLPSLAVAWLLGVALLSLRHLLGWQRVRALRRSGVEARPKLQRTFARLLEKFGRTGGVRLLESARVSAPMLAGVVKPAVLLPLRVVSGLGEREIEAILAHELAHFVRRDAWSHVAQIAIETLLFYHPAVWWIGRRARQERENAADDLALAVCTDRRVYAGALAQLAEMECASQAALAATGGSLLARIQRIVRPAEVESPAAGWSLCVPPILAVLTLALTTLFDAEAQVPKPAAAPEQNLAKSETLMKPWVADAFQLDDAAKREAAIQRIRTALRSTDADEARAGIVALQQIASVEFEKPSFRPEVRALLGSADAPTRAGAANAIAIIGGEPEDVERILALADDPTEEVRAVLTGVIVRLRKNDLRDKAASDAILKLMAKLPRDSRSVAHSLWGSQLSPEIEARALEFSRGLERASNSDVGYNFFYGTLSTQANKSEATVRRLIELLAHEDITNIAGRAAWGLHQGVDPLQYGLVADAMIKVIEARSEGYLRNQALGCVQYYGRAAQIPPLKTLLAKPGVSGQLKESIQGAIFVIEQPRANPNPKSGSPRNATATSQRERTPQDEANFKEAMRLEIATLKAKLAKPGPNNAYRQSLERALARIEAETPLSATTAENKQRARQRAAQDRQYYTAEQLEELEALYQVANKNWRTPEARESLTKLLEKFDRANRTGCATLYMGQMSEGQERLDYLTRAVEKFSDCYYLDGCQVGGYGRYVLAITLWEKGEKEKARALLGELRTKYGDTTDHRGQPMTTAADALESQWTP